MRATTRRRLAAKAAEIDGTIARLTAMREGLRHAAVCPAPSHLECPTFRRLLAGATAQARPARTGEKPRGCRGQRQALEGGNVTEGDVGLERESVT